MKQLNSITIYVAKDEFQNATSNWTFQGEVEGFPATVTQNGAVSPKPITDAIKVIVAEVLAAGPPTPPAP